MKNPAWLSVGLVSAFLFLAYADSGGNAYSEERENASPRALGDAPPDVPKGRSFEELLPLPPVKPEVITNGRRDKRKIALTFDACTTKSPSAYDDKITEALLRMNVKATIFLGGKWMREEREHVAMLAANPLFELGNHTYLHPHLTAQTDGRIREELRRTQKALYELTGRRATLFRPPYGEYDRRVIRIAAEMGLATVEYDLPSGDPDRHATREKLVGYVTEMAKSGSIVVMHINNRGWHTAEALPEIVETLRKKGYELVTVGELMADLRADRQSEKMGNPAPDRP